MRSPPDGPVIAAGSTGSIPATAKLLAIHRVTAAWCSSSCPALTAIWMQRAGTSGKYYDNPSIFGHPQYGLRKLLSELGVLRQDVVRLGKVAPQKRAREHLLAEAMRPADTSEAWSRYRPRRAAKFSGSRRAGGA